MRIRYTVVINDEHFPTFGDAERRRYADTLKARPKARLPDGEVVVETAESGRATAEVNDPDHERTAAEIADTSAGVRSVAQEHLRNPRRWSDPE